MKKIQICWISEEMWVSQKKIYPKRPAINYQSKYIVDLSLKCKICIFRRFWDWKIVHRAVLRNQCDLAPKTTQENNLCHPRLVVGSSKIKKKAGNGMKLKKTRYHVGLWMFCRYYNWFALILQHTHIFLTGTKKCDQGIIRSFYALDECFFNLLPRPPTLIGGCSLLILLIIPSLCL